MVLSDVFAYLDQAVMQSQQYECLGLPIAAGCSSLPVHVNGIVSYKCWSTLVEKVGKLS